MARASTMVTLIEAYHLLAESPQRTPIFFRVPFKIETKKGSLTLMVRGSAVLTLIKTHNLLAESPHWALFVFARRQNSTLQRDP